MKRSKKRKQKLSFEKRMTLKMNKCKEPKKDKEGNETTKEKWWKVLRVKRVLDEDRQRVEHLIKLARGVLLQEAILTLDAIVRAFLGVENTISDEFALVSNKLHGDVFDGPIRKWFRRHHRGTIRAWPNELIAFILVDQSLRKAITAENTFRSHKKSQRHSESCAKDEVGAKWKTLSQKLDDYLAGKSVRSKELEQDNQKSGNPVLAEFLKLWYELESHFPGKIKKFIPVWRDDIIEGRNDVPDKIYAKHCRCKPTTIVKYRCIIRKFFRDRFNWDSDNGLTSCL